MTLTRREFLYGMAVVPVVVTAPIVVVPSERERKLARLALAYGAGPRYLENGSIRYVVSDPATLEGDRTVLAVLERDRVR